MTSQLKSNQCKRVNFPSISYTKYPFEYSMGDYTNDNWLYACYQIWKAILTAVSDSWNSVCQFVKALVSLERIGFVVRIIKALEG